MEKFHNQIEELLSGTWKSPLGLTQNYSVSDLALDLETKALDEVIKYKNQRNSD
ncbi:MAG: hypothetical protein P1P73_11690 [Brevefilum sp.]|nr:hypothetical protein [Brevefilum sp.]